MKSSNEKFDMSFNQQSSTLQLPHLSSILTFVFSRSDVVEEEVVRSLHLLDDSIIQQQDYGHLQTYFCLKIFQISKIREQLYSNY